MDNEALEKRARKWLDETDSMQFDTVELLTMFAMSELKRHDDIIEGLKATAFQGHITGTTILNEIKKVLKTL